MSISSNKIKEATLTQAEISVLVMLSNSLLMTIELPQYLFSICELLMNNGFVKIRNVTRHGHKSCLAWDLTDEGRNYLIKYYKKLSNK